MSRRQEICRDFQRGNCRYGANCKYLHVLPQQQQQRSNQQQQKNDYGGRGNYYSALSTGNTTNSNRRQPQNQSPSSAKDHRCNDPRACKDLIKDDFANERPSWRLTCYTHYKFLPNDIVGDVSPEELRALAYEGAKQGLSLKDVAQREASMVVAKNAEFDALLRNPYKGPATQSSSFLTASPFLTPPQAPGASVHFGQQASFSTPPAPQGFAQSPFGGNAAGSFSFGQPSGNFGIGTQLTTVPNQSASVQQTNPFQPNPFGGSLGQTPPPQNFQPVVAPSLPQISPFQGIARPSPPTQGPFPNLQGSTGAFNTSAPQPPTFHTANQGFGSFTNFGLTPNANAAPTGPASVSRPNPATPLTDAVSTNGHHNAIWFQDVWKVGEIPEEEPPPEVRL